MGFITNNIWHTNGIRFVSSMPLDVQEAFNRMIRYWNLPNDEEYYAWIIGDYIFDKKSPDSVELDKIILDDWLVKSGVPDIADTAVLITS